MYKILILITLFALGYVAYAYRPAQTPYFVLKGEKENFEFNLVDPAMAPPEIYNAVIRGQTAMMHTKQAAPEYVGNTLSCCNCHLALGNTLGGENGGISLVGVSCVYPRYSERDHSNISLKQRFQNCFARSMNGKMPPEDAPVMNDLVAFMDWISFPLKGCEEFPWLGLPDFTKFHVADPKKGEQIFQEHCSICHGIDGQGNDKTLPRDYPPLWGDNSFNDGAGMNVLAKLSAFVFYNMPLNDPFLSAEQAIDVASFIISKPRPHFVKPAPKNEVKTEMKLDGKKN